MRTFFHLTLLLFLSLPALAQKSETRNHSNFTKLSIEVPAEVRLSRGPFKVVLEGDELEKVISSVKGHELKIEPKQKHQPFFGNSNKDLVIYISMPQLEGVSLSGSGQLESLDEFRSKNMKLSLSGSGEMRVHVIADDLEANVSGSGNIQAAGAADQFEAHISGSGKVKAGELRAQSVDVHISGSGDCEVHADKKLEAHISGSGNVRYSGTPATVNAHTSGSGRISKRGK